MRLTRFVKQKSKPIIDVSVIYIHTTRVNSDTFALQKHTDLMDVSIPNNCQT